MGIQQYPPDESGGGADLALHLADTVDAHDASAISFIPVGSIAAAEVQAAITELENEKQRKSGRFGGLYTLGDSYTQLGGGTDSTSVFPADQFSNFTHRLAAAFGIPSDEVFLLGRSGAAASSPSDGAEISTGAFTYPQGVGMVLQHILPPHTYSGQTSPILYHDSSSGISGLFVLKYGYNDISLGYASAGNSNSELSDQGLNAFKHGMRTIISRCRAKNLYRHDNAAVVLAGSGTWGTNTLAYCTTIGTSRRNPTNAGTITFTIPTTFKGGTVAICFLGGANSYTLANGAGTSSTNLTVDNRTNFPQSGNFDITINGTARTVNGGWGTGAGTFTLTSAATWADNAVVKRAMLGRVDWSGTATGMTGSTILSGQGRVGKQVQLVKRFALTAADAGKTIIATSAALGPNEYTELDSIWFEDPDPSSVLVADQPFGPFAVGAYGSHTMATVASINTAMTEVVAEFDSSVGYVPLEAQFAKWFGAQIQTLLLAASTTVVLTVTDPTECRIGVGSILRSDVENMRVTAIVSQVGSTWTLTVSRNYTGTYLGATDHQVGVETRDIGWLRPDLVHPSDHGHRLFTQLIIDKAMDMPQTVVQEANSGTYVARREPGVRNSSFLFSTGGSRANGTAAAFAQDVEYCVPFYMPGIAVLKELSIWVQAANAAGTNGVARLGIRQDSGNGQPGYLLLDAGLTPSTTVTTTGRKTITGLWQPLKPGWYWFVFVGQQVSQVVGGTQWNSTVALVTHKHLTSIPSGIGSEYLSLGRDSVSTLADFRDPSLGYSYTSTAKFPGALDSQFMNPFTTGASSTQVKEVPAICGKFTSPIRD